MTKFNFSLVFFSYLSLLTMQKKKKKIHSKIQLFKTLLKLNFVKIISPVILLEVSVLKNKNVIFISFL